MLPLSRFQRFDSSYGSVGGSGLITTGVKVAAGVTTCVDERVGLGVAVAAGLVVGLGCGVLVGGTGLGWGVLVGAGIVACGVLVAGRGVGLDQEVAVGCDVGPGCW